jgi:hypothetical protein
MMHSTTFRVIGAIAIVLALIAFLLRGTFGNPAPPPPSTVAPAIDSTLTPGAGAGK